jgi:hypothetical protein
MGFEAVFAPALMEWLYPSKDLVIGALIFSVPFFSFAQ